MVVNNTFSKIIVLFLIGYVPFLGGQNRSGSFETDYYGGYSLGIGGGVAVTGSAHTIKINPALMSYYKEYSVDFDYAWPKTGREFYNVSVVDSITSDIAVGAQYTNFKDKFKSNKEGSDLDSTANQRFVLSFSKGFSLFGLGFSGQYTRKYDLDRSNETARMTFGVGTTLNLGKMFRLGLSAENIGNKDFVDTNPLKYRVGVSTLLLNDHLSLQLEGLMKEHYFENPLGSQKEKFDRYITGSFITRIRNVFRVFGFYTKKLENEDKENSYGGGIGLGQHNYSINYMLSKKDGGASREISGLNIRMHLQI